MITAPLIIQGSFLLEKGLHKTQPEISFAQVVDGMNSSRLTKLNGGGTMVLSIERLNPDLFRKIHTPISPALVYRFFDAPEQGSKYNPVVLRESCKQCKLMRVQEFFFYFENPRGDRFNVNTNGCFSRNDASSKTFCM